MIRVISSGKSNNGNPPITCAYIASACMHMRAWVWLCNFTRDANMTQYDQCGAIGATARIDYQRGEALDVIMLTTSKKREKRRSPTWKRDRWRNAVIWWGWCWRKEGARKNAVASYLLPLLFIGVVPALLYKLFSLNLYPVHLPRKKAPDLLESIIVYKWSIVE